jgi:DNA-binding NarL/FixJ family response regulator
MDASDPEAPMRDARHLFARKRHVPMLTALDPEPDGSPRHRAGAETARAPASVLVAVSDPSPAYRRGLAVALLEAGFDTVDIGGSADWVALEPGRGPGPTVLLIHQQRLESDLVSVMRRSDAALVLIALLVDPSPSAYGDALRRGASAAVMHDAQLDEIMAVIAGALVHRSVLPVEVARFLADACGSAAEHPVLSGEELGWIAALSTGTTVSRLASTAGYSEREMYRRLRVLYGRLGAHSRLEAISNAVRSGLL